MGYLDIRVRGAGTRSLEDAYRVGVRIEELDIADLKAALAQVTNARIRQVYENLLQGSQNHLAAFTALLN